MPKPILVSPAPYSYSYGYARDLQVLVVAADRPTTFSRGDVRLRWTKRGICVKGQGAGILNGAEFLSGAEVIALFQDGSAFTGSLDAFGEQYAVHERRPDRVAKRHR